MSRATRNWSGAVVVMVMALANLPALIVCANSVRHGFLIREAFGRRASAAVQGVPGRCSTGDGS